MKINFHQKVIIKKGDKFLALKASYKGLRWDLPGGAVEIPETHEKALLREIEEETNLNISGLTPVEVSTGFNPETDEYFIFIGWQCNAASDKVTLSGEHTEYKWVTKDEFLGLEATDYLKEFVKKHL
ncbi:MAG: NUDIX domain-containing protein [Candidatus Saccharimonadales bacterium]